MRPCPRRIHKDAVQDRDFFFIALFGLPAGGDRGSFSVSAFLYAAMTALHKALIRYGLSLSPPYFDTIFPCRGKMVNKQISAGAEFTELKQRPFFTIIQSSKENNTRAKRNPGSRKKHTQFKNI
jgi:hypothetical protein